MNRARFLRLLFATVSVGVLVFDQVTKEWITSRMTLYSSAPVIPGLVHLTLVHNQVITPDQIKQASPWSPIRGRCSGCSKISGTRTGPSCFWPCR